MPSPLNKLVADAGRSLPQYLVHVGLVQTAAPSVEPLTTAEAKAHLRVDFADDDTLIDSFVQAARKAVEAHIHMSLITQKWQLTLNTFPSADTVRLPRGPVQSVQTLNTYDDDDAESTFAASNYLVDTAGDRVALNSAAVWPSDLRPSNAVVIDYTVGYGDASTDIPADILVAVRLLVGHYYENREGTVVGTIAGALPLGVSALLQHYVKPRL